MRKSAFLCAALYLTSLDISFSFTPTRVTSGHGSPAVACDSTPTGCGTCDGFDDFKVQYEYEQFYRSAMEGRRGDVASDEMTLLLKRTSGKAILLIGTAVSPCTHSFSPISTRKVNNGIHALFITLSTYAACISVECRARPVDSQQAPTRASND